ncbi:MAG: 4-alpha-glucanotransferase [Clostridia bacterium]|nr:4-alpha-glucanotransferase [Clostridia bacterium]
MRKSGILMPVFSLPSNQCCGTFGRGAYDFVRFLSKSGQKVWQILPLCPIDYTFSPYQSSSAFAGNPLFIDFELLAEMGLVSKSDFESFDKSPDKCDYKKAFNYTDIILKKAFSNFNIENFKAEYENFLEENKYWLLDFALYSVIKEENGGVAWIDFPDGLKERNETALKEYQNTHKTEIEFVFFTQFMFFKQLNNLKTFAHSLSVSLFGDMPIYVAFDSADCWAHKEAFMLNSDYTPSFVAGTPPDAFSEDGQVWGSPLYDFKAQSEEEIPYRFWKERIKSALKIYDIVRIDHFRAFEAFFAIPSKTMSASDGEWIKGPGIAFFNEIKRAVGNNLPIVAEDLGVITDGVKQLLKRTMFPGMKVLQFGFDGNLQNPYLPYNFTENSVGYIGTHDNETLVEFEKKHKLEAVRLMNYIGRSSESFNWAVIRLLMSSVANTVIFTMQDIAMQDESYRFNTPGTVENNWIYRIDPAITNDWLAGILKELTEQYGR